MANPYGEDELIEKTAMDIFYKELQWDKNYAFNNETFGINGSLGRGTDAEVILRKYLRPAILKLNPGLPDEAVEKAIMEVEALPGTASLGEINKSKYEMFRNGVKVTYRNRKGELVTDQSVRLFDFNNPKENHFLVVQQLWVRGPIYRKRPDIIGFVNGIPLLFIELKAVHVNVRAAYDQNFADYKDTIPHLLYHNAFIILSNGAETKFGSLTGKFEHFTEWKRIDEDEEGIISLETTLRGICDKERFMDLFENFILYDQGKKGTVKLIAKNHQYLGVNRAIQQVIDSKQNKGRLGVFWHTQGSGKSYSMVFFCRKILRKISNNYSFLIVTDREELDRQIYTTFKNVDAISTGDARAASGNHLRELLAANRGFVFTLIHKFNESQVVTRRDNIIVISDEAHRTQNGFLAYNMRKAIPNAAFIGFTGTPLIKGEDEKTKEIFGDYVSVYDFQRAVDDNATVPLYYENRGEHLHLNNPVINQQMREAVEEENLDLSQLERIRNLFLKNYPILTAEQRLRQIAQDIVWHFLKRGYKGKGMVVCIDKITAVRMFGFITEYWNEELSAFKAKKNLLQDEQELMEYERELAWRTETEINVVVSEEQGEVERFRNWGIDIKPLRKKMKDRELETDFKNDEHPFRLVVVCAMWITGFDVQSLSTLYLDKPMKGHTLMQTIARANRVYQEKSNGLIVDYIETYKSLKEALAYYGKQKGDTGGGDTGGGEGEGEGGEGPAVKEKLELFEHLKNLISGLEHFLKSLGTPLESVTKANGKLEQIAAISDMANEINRNDKSRNEFIVKAREADMIFWHLLPLNDLEKVEGRIKAIRAVLKTVVEGEEIKSIDQVIVRLQKIVDESVITATHDSFREVAPIDLSRIDFDKLQKLFQKEKHKNTMVRDVMAELEKIIKRKLDVNPFRTDLEERYKKIIKLYNKGKSEAEVRKVFDEIMAFMKNLSLQDKEAIRANLNEDDMAIFDLLRKEKLSKADQKKVQQVAKELLEKLKREKLTIENWREKSQISAQIRTEILDHLISQLPESYDVDEINQKSLAVYQHIWRRFPNLRYHN